MKHVHVYPNSVLFCTIRNKGLNVREIVYIEKMKEISEKIIQSIHANSGHAQCITIIHSVHTISYIKCCMGLASADILVFVKKLTKRLQLLAKTSHNTDGRTSNHSIRILVECQTSWYLVNKAKIKILSLSINFQ